MSKGINGRGGVGSGGGWGRRREMSRGVSARGKGGGGGGRKRTLEVLGQGHAADAALGLPQRLRPLRLACRAMGGEGAHRGLGDGRLFIARGSNMPASSRDAGRACLDGSRRRERGVAGDGPDMILPSQRSGTALPTPGPSATFQTARPLSVVQLRAVLQCGGGSGWAQGRCRPAASQHADWTTSSV